MTTRPRRKSFQAGLLAGSMFFALLTGAPAFAGPVVGDIETNTLSGVYLAARTADAGNDIAAAAELYRAAVKMDPENLFLLERALVTTAASGELEQAVGYARDLLTRVPTSHPARLIIAVDEIRAGKHSEAIEMLGRPGAGVLADLTSALLVAWARFGEGEVDKALEDLTALKGEDWYEPFKLLHSGYISLASGRTEEAIRLLEQARKLDPNAVRITEAYAAALAVVGRKAAAEAALDDFISRFPDNPLALAARERLRSGSGPSGAVGSPVQGAAEALAGLGAAVGQEGGADVGSLYLRLALHLQPQAAGGLAALSLGTLLESNGQGEAAIEVFESIAPDAPFRPLGVLRSALALDRMDRTEEAERAFKEVLQRSPEDIQAYISYANMLRGRERFAEAANIYSEAIKRIGAPAKSDWSLFYFRGIAYERTKEWDKAEADFRKALELFPDQPLVLNYLGYSLVDMGRNLEEGLAMVRKAVDLRPEDGYIVDSLGWAYYRLGRFDEAVRELERAVSLQAGDPVIQDHLGDAYWKVGRTLEAQFQWRHARDFGAKSPELDLILKKIAERRLIEKETEPAVKKAEAEPN